MLRGGSGGGWCVNIKVRGWWWCVNIKLVGGGGGGGGGGCQHFRFDGGGGTPCLWIEDQSSPRR